jgi:hypothetical protein
MTRKIVNIFFLFVFTTQVLPIQQVGRILFQASMVEELPEKTPSKSAAGLEDDYKHFAFHSGTNSILKNNTQPLYLHFSETLPSLMAGDIHTPPPDFS